MPAVSVQDLVNTVDHVENYGKDYEMYKIYFKDGSILHQTEKEFMFMDKLVDGDLAVKVIN